MQLHRGVDLKRIKTNLSCWDVLTNTQLHQDVDLTKTNSNLSWQDVSINMQLHRGVDLKRIKTNLSCPDVLTNTQPHQDVDFRRRYQSHSILSGCANIYATASGCGFAENTSPSNLSG